MQIIKKFIFSFFLILKCSASAYSIVIQPSENNRSINTEYEKNLTLLYAESLRNFMCYENNTCNVEITRIAGEKLEYLQAANFSNIINPNIHISLHCVESTEPEIFIYFNQWNFNEQNNIPLKKLSLVSAFESHIYQCNFSKCYAQKLSAILKKESSNIFLVYEPIGFPCKSLFGVTSPAIAIEIGIPFESNPIEYKKILIETIGKCILTCSES